MPPEDEPDEYDYHADAQDLKDLIEVYEDCREIIWGQYDD